MREAEFLNELYRLLEANVIGLAVDQKIDLIHAVCDEVQQTAALQPLTAG